MLFFDVFFLLYHPVEGGFIGPMYCIEVSSYPDLGAYALLNVLIYN